MKDKSNVGKTLLLPFENGALPPPDGDTLWSMLNGRVLPAGSDDWPMGLEFEQGFRPGYLSLQRAGYSVHPALSLNDGLDGALVVAGRVRSVNNTNLIRAWNACREGGMVVCSGSKTSGIQSLRKWVSARTQIAGSLSKHHAVVLWFRKTGGQWDSLEDGVRNVDGYQIGAGMFSADGPDVGSKILAEQFGPHMRGKVADFGAGWGYLSAELLKKSPHVERIDLFEAEYAALEMAKANLSVHAKDVTTSYHWVDMQTENPKGPFNWIIMNPPFHADRAADPGLGQDFIRSAAAALPSGGRLLMVANRNLPYERLLQELFKRVDKLEDRGGFKVIEAVR